MEPIQILKSSLFFENLSDAKVAALERQATVLSVEKNDLIIREGEPGDAFYVVVEGAVRVTATAADGSQVPLARLVAGDHFGEQALLEEQPSPRTATVQAIEASTLYKVPRSVFREIIKFDSQLHELLSENGQQYLIDRLRKQSAAMQSIAVNLSEFGRHLKSFGDREVIFYQEDPPDLVYALVSGTVRIRFLDEERQTTSVVSVTPGQIFGELSAVRGSARHGTAVAVGDVQTIAIPAQEIWQLHQSSPEFRNLCSSLQNIYDVPAVGQVMQYQGTFLDMPAHCLLIRKNEGADFISYKLIDSDVFAVSRTQVEATEVLRHEANDEDVREISLRDDELIGITSFGSWPDSSDMAALVMTGPRIGEEDKQSFRAKGTLPAALRRLDMADPGVLCRCMRVRTASIDAIIASGLNDLGEITVRTGAGSVCGACAPRIRERLGHDVWTACTLQEPVRHTDDMWSFRLAPRSGTTAPFTPGQHIVVRAEIGGNQVERAYTLTSSPGEPYYEITVKREANGLFSGWLFDQTQPETTVYASAPQGEFSVDVEARRPIIFFCGGIGITPAIALLRHALHAPADNPEIFLDYSARTTRDIVYSDLIDDAANSVSGLRFRQRATSVEGRLTEAHVGRLLDSHANPLVYLCGPKPFEESVVRMLRAHGVPDADIHVEQFTPVIARAA